MRSKTNLRLYYNIVATELQLTGNIIYKGTCLKQFVIL